MIKTILAPSDGPEHAAEAVGFALDPAEKNGAKVHLRLVLRGSRFETAQEARHLSPRSCITVF